MGFFESLASFASTAGGFLEDAVEIGGRVFDTAQGFFDIGSSVGVFDPSDFGGIFTTSESVSGAPIVFGAPVFAPPIPIQVQRPPASILPPDQLPLPPLPRDRFTFPPSGAGIAVNAQSVFDQGEFTNFDGIQERPPAGVSPLLIVGLVVGAVFVFR